MGIFKKKKKEKEVIEGMANPFSKKEKTNTYSLEYSYAGEVHSVNKNWILGCRKEQNVVSIKLKGSEGVLEGTVTYAGEGEIFCTLTRTKGNNYAFVDQWNGKGDFEWSIGDRENQEIVEIDLSSDSNNNEQNVLKGTVTYAGEGPIGLKCYEQV
ncbi:lectin OAA [Francisella sp. SYW-2]|uniref:lectin OAA n=1 Tax=Francisella sp. SYW-2 TaxID=2610886 RepID=UPI00123D8A08|nr:lectin OAA [Francisella sp. SYW-2]